MLVQWSRLALGVAVLAAAGNCFGYTMTKIAAKDTLVPGTSSYFSSFSEAAISGSNVAFLASYTSSTTSIKGVYLYSGGVLSRIADSNTAFPRATGDIFQFSGVDIIGGTVIFSVLWGNGDSGLYSSTGTGVNVVADGWTRHPSGSGYMETFSTPSISGDEIAFRNYSSGGFEDAVVRKTAVGFLILADQSSSIPMRGGTFDGFGSVVSEGTSVVFTRSVGGQSYGIYRGGAEPLSVVADENTSVPGRAVNFATVWLPAVSGENVYFRGVWGPTGSGLYHDSGSSLSMVVDDTTSVPEGIGTFSGITSLAVSGDTLLFGGQTPYSSQNGLYGRLNGQLRKILLAGETVNGATVSSVAVSSKGLDGNLGALPVATYDGTQSGIYLLDLTTAGVDDWTAY